MNEKEKLQAQLDAAGLEYDGRWGEDRLREALADSRAMTAAVDAVRPDIIHDAPSDVPQIEIVVMATTNVKIGDAKLPFRWRGKVPVSDYEAICALDDKAGREHRLMKL